MGTGTILLFNEQCSQYYTTQPFGFAVVTAFLFLLLVPGFSEYLCTRKRAHEFSEPSISATWRPAVSKASVVIFIMLNLLWYICYCVYSLALNMIIAAFLLLLLVIVTINPDGEHVIIEEIDSSNYKILQEVEATIAVHIIKELDRAGNMKARVVHFYEPEWNYTCLEIVHTAAAATFFIGLFVCSILVGVWEVQSDVLTLYWVMMTIEGFCLVILLVPLLKPCFGQKVGWGRRTNHFEITFATMACLIFLFVEQGYPPP